MEEQAGIYRITLYEAKDLLFVYGSESLVSYVNSIETAGVIITLENSDCNTMDLDLSFESRRSGNNKLLYKHTITWDLLGIDKINLDKISQLKTSIYGWVALIEFYNNTAQVIENPFRFVNSSIDNNVSNHYNIELKNVLFGKRVKEYKFAPLTWILEDGTWRNIDINGNPTRWTSDGLWNTI